MSYDKKYKKRVIEYREEGHTLKETGEVFKVSESRIKIWVKEFREKGYIEDNKKPNRKHKKIEPDKLRQLVEKEPDMYLKEMAEKFNCSINGVWKALKKENITLKKRQ